MSDPYRAPPAVRRRGSSVGRPKRLLADLHLYQPEHNAGAEVMVHALLRTLQGAGWEIRVVARDVSRDFTFGGIDVRRVRRDVALASHYEWSDVVLTHLDTTKRAVIWARRGRRPLVHVVHNHNQLNFHGVIPGTAALVIWNSQWIADELADWTGASMIVRPPVLSADYRVARPGAKAVTLINITEAKGAPLFWQLAAAEPERPFIAVLGSYGAQIVPRRIPANVEIVENGPDMKAVYARTRVLLCPSSYESWGRVGVEALASDIPVIAHPTPGLRESLGEAGIFLDRDKPDLWRSVLRRLDDGREYRAASVLAAARSVELDDLARADLAAFVARLERL